MPKIAKELTALDLRRLSAGLHAAGGVPGLLFRVKPSGARSWILRAVVGGKRRDIGLGSHPAVTLQQARETARTMRADIAQGTDPVAARRDAQSALRASAARRATFDDCARQFLAKKQAEFRNAKHRAQWAATLAAYASPVIGALPVDQIELAHIVKLLEGIWTEKTETAIRVRGRVESVLAYAIAAGYRRAKDNPARWRGNLDAILAKPRKLAPIQHYTAIPIDGMPQFFAALRQREGMAARALEFVILTAARSGEVRGATWAEIDFEAKTWTVPAERMKASKQHTVPLSPAALELLKGIPRDDRYPLVFWAPRGGKLSNMSLSAVMRRMAVDAVPHGLRSTFRDWCAERTNYPHEVAEMALAHTIGSGVERAYRRGDLFAKRTRLMNDWAKFCQTTTQAANITPIRKRRGASR